MVSHSARTKANAEERARKLRKMGLNASVYKKKKGWGVSSTR